MSDLNSSSQVSLARSPLGPIKVALGSDAFTKWVEGELEADEVVDEHDLVKRLFEQHATTAETDQALNPNEVHALSPAEIDALATELLQNGELYFRPSFIRADGPKGRVRRRTESERAVSTPIEGACPAKLLLEALRAWRQDRLDRLEWLEQKSKTPTSLIQQQQALVAAAQVWKEQAAVLKAAGYQSPLSEAARAISDITRPSRLLTGSLAQVSGYPSHTMLAQVEAQQRLFRETVGALSRHPAQTNITELTTRYQNVGSIIARSIQQAGGLGSLMSAQRAIQDIVGRTGLDHSITLNILANQADMARRVRKEFDVTMPRAVLAALSAMTVAPDAAALSLTVYPPGYQLVAAVGLSTQSAHGLVAEILGNYGEPPVEETPMFAAALDSTSLIDGGGTSPAQTVNFLAAFAYKILGLTGEEPDPVRRQALFTVYGFIITLLVSAAGTVAGTLDAYYGSVQVELAREAQEEAADPKVVEELRDANQRIAALEAQQRLALAEDRSLRYVHARTPLRVDPHGKALMIRYIYQDQVLRVLETRDNWVQIETIEYSAEKPLRGWVHRRAIHLEPN